MAFYSVHLDDEGQEIETTRKTFRKDPEDDITDESSGSARRLFSIDYSSQSISNKTSTISSGNNAIQLTKSNFKTVRYVNPATFIETDKKKSPPSSTDDMKEEESTESEMNNGLDVNYGNQCNGEQQYQTHLSSECETIPLLELCSDESFPSSSEMTYSYRKVCEVAKMIKKPDAFKEWLAAKKAVKVYEEKKRLENLRKEEEEKQKKRELAEERFKAWLQKKEKQKLEQIRSKPPVVKEEEPPDNDGGKLRKLQIINSGGFSSEIGKEENFKAWLKKKLEKQKYSKKKQEEDEQREQLLDQKRREEASRIYEEWLKTAPEKPKPVPLNKGLLSLKGSISEMYVNPTPWVSSLQEYQEVQG